MSERFTSKDVFDESEESPPIQLTKNGDLRVRIPCPNCGWITARFRMQAEAGLYQSETATCKKCHLTFGWTCGFNNTIGAYRRNTDGKNEKASEYSPHFTIMIRARMPIEKFSKLQERNEKDVKL